MERKNKARAETGIYLVVVATILVVANIISFSAYKRLDTTKSERFSLSKGSAHLVSEKLNKDLDITLYVTHGLPKHEVFIQDLTDLLNEYERASKGKLHYTIVEPKTDDERAKAKEDGMQEAAFGEGSKTGKDQALISKGFMGISFKYGSEKEAIPIMSPEQSQGLEFWITNKIREIHDRADNDFHKIGLLTGKDEIKLSESNLIASQGRGQAPSMRGIIEQALPFYKFEDVDLQNGDAEINKELSGLIITQLGKELTEKEARRIDQFLMLGNKSLAVFASAVNLKANDATMKATLDIHGIDKLLDGYGVELKKDAIFDRGRPAVIRVLTQGMPIVFGYPTTVLAQHDDRADEQTQFLDQSFAGFFRLEEVVFPFASTLIPHPEKQPEATLKVVARTSPSATVATTDTVEMKPTRDFFSKVPQGDSGQRAIALTLEGKIKSAFAGKEDGAVPTSAESKDKSRILMISSSEFLANPWARAGNAPPMPPQMMMMGSMGGDEELQTLSQPYAQQYLTGTILAFKNTLDWMGGESDLLATSAKLLGDTTLAYRDIERPKLSAASDPDVAKRQAEEYDAAITKVQDRVKWTLTLFPAALFALLGLLRWRWRESQRAAITLD
jgi:hypothetical protein